MGTVTADVGRLVVVVGVSLLLHVHHPVTGPLVSQVVRLERLVLVPSSRSTPPGARTDATREGTVFRFNSPSSSFLFTSGIAGHPVLAGSGAYSGPLDRSQDC